MINYFDLFYILPTFDRVSECLPNQHLPYQLNDLFNKITALITCCELSEI